MTQTWKQVRARAVASGQLDEQRVAESRARALAEVRASKLAELRHSAGLSQTVLAQKLGISQSRLSRIERGDLEHSEVATLRAFAEALGAELEITVKRGDERLRLG